MKVNKDIDFEGNYPTADAALKMFNKAGASIRDPRALGNYHPPKKEIQMKIRNMFCVCLCVTEE